MSAYRLILGDCLEAMRALESGSIDAVVTDPPYPEIDRPYGRMTEAEWHAMMRALVPEVRRVLRPQGSAVFVLQPNSRKVGSMRPWLWQFMAWVCEEWNMVQDAYWWNACMLPTAHAIQGGLMRTSVKACVWCGPPNCYRNQIAVLSGPSVRMKRMNTESGYHATGRRSFISGQGADGPRFKAAVERRGGSTPFNMLDCSYTPSERKRNRHSAPIPLKVCRWWVRYICLPGGTVLDPFSGSGTVGVAALEEGRRYVGVERVPAYHEIAARRLEEAARAPLLPGCTG